jgi:nitronate monooxygenase
MPEFQNAAVNMPLVRAEAFCRRFRAARADPAGADGRHLSGWPRRGGRQCRRHGRARCADDRARRHRAWAAQFRGQSNGSFQINLWVPDPEPLRDAEAERRVREFLGQWGPPVPPETGDAMPLDFDAQCDALLAAAPRVVSTIMGCSRTSSSLR